MIFYIKKLNFWGVIKNLFHVYNDLLQMVIENYSLV